MKLKSGYHSAFFDKRSQARLTRKQKMAEPPRPRKIKGIKAGLFGTRLSPSAIPTPKR